MSDILALSTKPSYSLHAHYCVYTTSISHQYSVEVEVLSSLSVVATLILELGTVVDQIHHLWFELQKHCYTDVHVYSRMI